MKIGIMADSHDHIDKVEKAAKVFKKHNVKLILHAGDVVAPTTLPPLLDLKLPIFAVCGNNDGEVVILNKLISSTGGKLHRSAALIKYKGIVITLFHEHEVAMELQGAPKIDLVVWGHTHRLYVEHGKPILLNPGECCGLLTKRPTVAIVTIENKRVLPPEIVELK